MAEEIYIDEFDLTPEPTELKQDRAKLPEEKVLPKEIPVPGLDKKEETNLTATDIIFGPDTELQGDSFLAAGKLGRRIKKINWRRFNGYWRSWSCYRFVAGVIDGTIKIPYGIVNLTAEIADVLRRMIFL